MSLHLNNDGFFSGTDSWDVLGSFSFIITSVCLVCMFMHTHTCSCAPSWRRSGKCKQQLGPVCDKSGSTVFSLNTFLCTSQCSITRLNSPRIPQPVWEKWRFAKYWLCLYELASCLGIMYHGRAPRGWDDGTLMRKMPSSQSLRQAKQNSVGDGWD